MLALEDLKNCSENEVKEFLSKEYSGKDSGFSYGEITESDINEAREKLKDMSILIAYESVGDYGCDSSSFFLMKDNKTKILYEVHGSHCSCYGFEGQLDLEETDIESLKERALKSSVFHCGGYDDDETENQKLVNEYILKMT